MIMDRDRLIQFTSQNVVNKLADLWEVDVDVFYLTNDECDKFVEKLIKNLYDQIK